MIEVVIWVARVSISILAVCFIVLSVSLGYAFYREVIVGDLPCGAIMGNTGETPHYCGGGPFPSR